MATILSGMEPSLTTSARFFIGIGMDRGHRLDAFHIDGSQFLDEGEDGIELVLQMRHVGLADLDPRQMRDAPHGRRNRRTWGSSSWLKQAGYSTGALTQAMRGSASKFWYEIFAQTYKNVSRETFWCDWRFAQSYLWQARRGTKVGFGARGNAG